MSFALYSLSRSVTKNSISHLHVAKTLLFTCPNCGRLKSYLLHLSPENYVAKRIIRTVFTKVSKLGAPLMSLRLQCVSKMSSSGTDKPPTPPEPVEASTATSTPAASNPEIKVVPKIKTDVKYDGSVKSGNYITPLRAMREFHLQFSDLEQLPKHTSRSPYSYETRTTVYSRAEVENLAFQKHGGKEAFLQMRKKVQQQEKNRILNIFDIKKAMKNLSGSTVYSSSFPKRYPTQYERPRESLFQSKSGRIVLTAVVVNALNTSLKGLGWWMTGSKSMLSETLHSLADTVNQILLAVGVHQSLAKPDETHPYGYGPLRNVFALVSAGVFFIGASVSVIEGFNGIMTTSSDTVSHDWLWAIVILCGSLISEGATCVMAYKHVQAQAVKNNMTVFEFIGAGYDPSTTVVLMEDLAAVAGVAIAATSMSLTTFLGSPYPDAIGAIVIGSILASVAVFIVHSNAQALIGRSIPFEQREAMLKVIEKHKVIKGIYDIKATMMGTSVRFKAEVDINGIELTKRYLETMQLSELLKEMNGITTEEQVVAFMLKHGDNIVNNMGAEINTIEASIKKEFPKVKHIDIEIN